MSSEEQHPNAWLCVAGPDECYITAIHLDEALAYLSSMLGGLNEWRCGTSDLRTKPWRKHPGSWSVGDIVLRPL